MWATEPQDLLVTRLPGTDLSQRLLRRDRAFLAARCFSPAHVNARSQCSTEPPRQRADEWPCQVSEPEEQHGNKDRPPRQPSRKVRELHLQHLGRQAFRRQEREPECLRVTPRFTHPATRRRRNHLIDLEVVGVGEVDHQHGEVASQRHDAVPRSEIEWIQRYIPDIAKAHRDEVPPPPERVLYPAHAPRDNHVLQWQFEPDEPVQARHLGYPGEPDVRGAARPAGWPAFSAERYKRRLAQSSWLSARSHFGPSAR